MAAFAKIAIGAALIAGAIVGTVLSGGTLTPALLSTIVTGASLVIGGIGSLLTKGPPTPGIASRNPIAPWNVVYGRARVGGTTVYVEENGTTNKYLHQVIVLACHPCQAVDQLLFNNKRVVLDANGNSISFGDSTAVIGHQQSQNIASITRVNDVVTVTLTAPLPPPAGQDPAFQTLLTGDMLSVQNVGVDHSLNGTFTVTVVSPTVVTYISGGNPVTVTNQGQVYTLYPDWGDTVHMEVLLGTQTSTFPTLLAESNGLWTNEHLLSGRTCVYLRLKYGGQTYANGLPSIAFVIRGKNDILDPRTNLTGYSENAALCIADYLAQKTFGFKATYGTEIPLPDLIAAANICDEQVPIAAGGTEPRYACNGQFALTTKRGEVLQNLLTACAGRLTYTGGQFVIHPGAWTGPTAKFGTRGRAFTGSDWIDFGGQAALYVQGDWSAGLWVYLTPASHGSVIAMVGAGSGDPSAAAPYVLAIRSGPAAANGSPQFGLEYVHDVGSTSAVVGHEYLLSPVSTIPSNSWVYVGASRNSTAKTVSFYWGDGTTIYSLGNAQYSNTPGIVAGEARLTLGAFYYVNLTNTPAAGDFNPSIVQIDQAYMWGQNLTAAQHMAAMTGTPDPGLLLLNVTAIMDDPLVPSVSPVLGTIEGIVHGGITQVSGPFIPISGLSSAAGPFQWKSKLSIRDLYNGVKGTYISPANNWQTSDIPPYAQDQLHGYSFDANLAADGGDRRWYEIQLPFTISTPAAQRLAKIELMRRRQQGTGTFAFNMAMYQATALDIVEFTLPVLGWNAKLLEITAHRFTLNDQSDKGQSVTVLGTEIDVQEANSSIYDWDPFEELSAQDFQQAALPNNSQAAPPIAVTAASNGTTTSVGADGIARTRIAVSWTAPADGYVTNGGSIQVQYRQTGTTNWISLQAVDPSVTTAYIDNVNDGQSYDVQVRSVNVAGAASPWVSAGPVVAASTISQISSSALAGLPLILVNGS